MEIYLMQKTMKSSAIKTIIVSLTADLVSEHAIDTDIFDDPYLEAATRAVETSRKRAGAIIPSITQCWDKKTPNKKQIYNSYWILVNASRYKLAEELREKLKLQHDIDLAKEPIHGRDTKNP